MIIVKLPTGIFEYDPSKPLGKAGGFGQVFLGKSSRGEDVAIKKLHVSAADAAHRELHIADELRGRTFEHVVPFIDAGEDADTGDYFVVMPKAEYSLQNKLTNHGLFSASEAASILFQIAQGLIEVGELVHRDLKPDNVLYYEGKWAIADFGIARFVEEATASNTLKECLSPYYAAPEQWRLERASHATDVYALGCIAFSLLVGTPPFISNPQADHQSAAVPFFDCAEPRLSTLVNMCLRKVAASRPSQSRVCTVLEEIVTKPQLAGGASSLGTLAVAAAHVSIEEQKIQAREASEKAAWTARLELAKGAHEILANNVERLWGKVHSQAANARRNNGISTGLFQCHLGAARLEISLNMTTDLELGIFSNSGWDVVTYSQISVNQVEPHYKWSASLWFAKLKGETDCRWYEASYWRFGGYEFEPHAVPPGADADFAASNIMHSVNIAYGPIAIDDENEVEFHDRWILLLSKAAVGQLRRPTRLPIELPLQL